jgi:hypothetical protein
MRQQKVDSAQNMPPRCKKKVTTSNATATAKQKEKEANNAEGKEKGKKKKKKEKEFVEPKIKWRDSKAKQLLYQDVREETVPMDAYGEDKNGQPWTLQEIFSSRPEFSECLEICLGQLRDHNRPFFLLMPNYVAAWNYYHQILGELAEDLVYVIPSTP